MIDPDEALAAAMLDFARPVTVTPLASQAGHGAYPARGLWSSNPVDVEMQDNSILSSQNHTLGVRHAEFAVPVIQGDEVEIPAYLSLPRIGVCLVEDVDDDGQGGAVWSLKVIGP